ncbi:hypothetical protein ACFQ21_13220 [Ohtaekwangia kribbensis]|jgi:hypothetical protein|uniref:Uncharacterized protein n=1 Tax=Ohtaekwangia kribbensis TaxID=688913 RepID=A0ABW3K1X4_9BACT
MAITEKQKEDAILARGQILSVSSDLEFVTNEIIVALIIPKSASDDITSEGLLEAFILRHLTLRKKMELVKDGLTSIGLFDEVREIFNEINGTFIPVRNKAAHSLPWYGQEEIGFGGLEFEKSNGEIVLKQAKLSMDDWGKFCDDFKNKIKKLREIKNKVASVVIKK